MKKSITLISLAAYAALSFTAHADLNGTGYYRITNNYTNRYIYVTDNKGSINYSTTSADMGAIDLWMGIERTLYDPATVLYCQHITGKQYDIQSQNTGIHQMIGFYVTLTTDPRVPDAYIAYGTAHGLSKYLFDGRSNLEVDWSYLSDSGKSECKYWKINPIDSSTDNYFGIKSTVTTSGGEYYAPFFAEFPFSFASSGMKACYITKIDTKLGYAVYKEITGTVPGATPLFIKCNSNNHSDNRLNLGGDAAALNDNIGVGVYFNSDKANHVNQVAYNPQTMRVLGTMTDGTLALVTENYDFVPRNTFYVNVPAGAPAQFQIVSESEYAEILANAPVDATGITLSQSTLTLTIGETATLTANVLPADASDRSVTWTSSNTSVATVDANGMVSTTGIGSATITAKTHNGLTATCQVTVNPVAVTSVTLSNSTLSMYPGQTKTLTATVLPENASYKSVTWTTDNSDIATVDANGVVTAKTVGNATITATAHNGVKATCSVTVAAVDAQSIVVAPDLTSVFPGMTRQLVATITPANTTDKTVTWTSSDTQVATVDDNGLVTGVVVGEVTITATTHNGLQSSSIVRVIPIPATDVTLNTNSLTLTVDEQATLIATLVPENASYPTVQFSSTDANVASVTFNGVVTAHRGGTAEIHATCGNAVAKCTVTVLKKTQIITWNQEFGEVYEGDKLTLLAEASSGLDIRYEVTSDNAAVEGKELTVLTPGEVKVRAHQDGDDRHEAAEPVELSFSALAGINDAVYDSVSVQVDGAAVEVTGKPADAEVRIYSMSGLPVYTGTDSRILLQGHTAYIVVVGNRNFKIFTK